MNWYAVYTKPKCEDTVSQLLGNAGLETLNPKIKVVKHTRGRYAEVVEPLFPSYIFALFDKDTHAHMIKYTRGVKYIVGKDDPLAVHPEIISAIQGRMEGGIVSQDPVDVSRGDRIIIKEGPFKDFYGIFQRNVPGKKRAVILLETLYCTLHIESRHIKKA